MQEVRCYRRCGVAGGQRLPPLPLVWSFVRFYNFVFCCFNVTVYVVIIDAKDAVIVNVVTVVDVLCYCIALNPN